MTSSDPSVQLDHTPGHIKHDGHNLTGFVIFLCSESIIFLAFFAGFSL
ncbi:MAG TPA: heme-copper oxidase subunit III, partial [Synechococcales bacterium UBA8647]|nr:heme-copper oxidase subunit III [Synechococcales bacterium UBA8647]